MSKLNGGAKEWTPNVTAPEFVPKTPVASTVPQQHAQLNTNAAPWQGTQGNYHNVPAFVPTFPGHVYPPVYDPYNANAMYAPYGQQNMVAPNMGMMHQAQGGYQKQGHGQGNNFQNGGNNNHHNKKNHSNNHNNGNNTQNKSSDSTDKSKGTKNKAKVDSNNNEEPKFIFGDLDESEPATSSSSNKTDNTAPVVEKPEVVEKAEVVEKEQVKVPEVVNKVEKVEVSKPEVEKVKETVVETPPAVPVRVVEVPRGVPVEEKKSEQSSGWKRNVDMVEKTTAQMLLRSDGVTRYGKSQLCSMNSWNKSCPDEIKLMYLDLAKIERPPMSETTRQKSPHNHKGNSNNHHKNHHKNKNNQPEEPHPDELKIFSSEHLKSDNLFGGGRPDKVVDTTSSEGIVAQANFILNVMTIETFDKMSDKFMKVGLESEELMKMAVDLIVSKAQLEEHFSFMYAELCKKITDQWVTSDGEEGTLGKEFRLLLLKRCQEEFEQDRDAAVQEVLDLKLDRDDEEEKLLILKKRYTGHMRFVGEIYMKDMLKANKMHYCITELLESKNENGSADEEKLACLCKLFQTIGKKLEDYELKKKRTKVQEYFDKIAILSNDKSLSSKIRFGFKDLIEMRNNNWTARRVEEKAKKLSEIRKDDAASNQGTPRSTANTPRGSGFTTGNQDARQRGGPQDARSAQTDEWTTIPVTTKGKKGRGGGFSGSNSASSTPSASSGNSSLNKFSALNVNTRNSASARGGSNKNSPSTVSSSNKRVSGSTSSKLQVDTASSAASSPKESPVVTLLPGHDGEVDSNTTRRIIAAHDEYYGNLIEDEIVEVLKELVHENGMWKAVYSAMKSVMGKSAGHLEKYQALLPVLYKRGVLTRAQAVKGISSFLHEFDDMVIDVPKLAGYFGDIIAHAYVNGVFEGDVRFFTTLPDDNDFTISYRMMSVIVHIATTIKTIASEEKAVEFFKSAIDLSAIDKMQKTQLDEAIESYKADFLMA